MDNMERKAKLEKKNTENRKNKMFIHTNVPQ